MTIELAGYEDVTLLGRGGFSRVYRARQVEFDRWVAVKVLDIGMDRRQREAFERECRAMGVVSQHPNIVTVLSAAFTADSRPAIVMELYGGGTYADRVKRETRLPFGDVLEVGIRISGALQSAHDRGLLHRDVKPQNIFVSDYGEPALGDFGISSFADEDSGGSGLTIHYAAPEVIEHQRATASSDVYALAVTLYTLVAGRRPFAVPGERQQVADVALRILREPPPRIGGDCPSPLERAILQGMAKDAADRPASAASFGRLLQAAQEGIGIGRTELAVVQPAARDLDDVTLARDDVAAGQGMVDEEQSATLARVRTPGEPGVGGSVEDPAGARDTAPRWRMVASVVAGVAAVAALLGGGFWATQGDRAPSDTVQDVAQPADPDPDAADDTFFVRVVPPDDVTITRDDDAVVVAWTAQDGLTYEIERVDGDASDRRVTDDGEVVLDDIGPDEVPCVVVRSVSEAGQLSARSSPECAGDR